MTMRILMICDFYHPYLGGVEQHVRSLSHALVEQGHHVAVATIRHGSLAAEEADGGVKVYRIQTTAGRATALFRSAERPWGTPFPDPEATLGLRRVMAAERPDIVHGHDWLARSYLPLQPFHKAKLVVSFHYYTHSCAKKSLMRDGAMCDGAALQKCLPCAAAHYGAGKGYTVAAGNWMGRGAEERLADAFISVSLATARGNGMPVDARHTVIPNFIAAAPASLDAGQLAALEQLPAEPFILYVGDLRRDKGIDLLLHAYAALEDAPPLVLIGKRWPESPTEFPPNVSFFEKWGNDAVRAAWRRALFGVVPSRWAEPFGIVVIEAMMAAKPVIGARVGGIPEIITEGSGLLVPPGDSEALARAMRRLITDAELRAEMGRAAWLRAQDFHRDRVVPRILGVYEQVRGKPSPRVALSAPQAASGADVI